MWGGRPHRNLLWRTGICEGPKRARCRWRIEVGGRDWSNVSNYLWVYRTQMDENDWTCISLHFRTRLIVLTCTSSALISIDQILELHIPCKILAQDVSRRLKTWILRAELDCRPKMASIQRTPTWTRLIRSCYCPLPTFVPFWVSYVGNFAVFVRGITWSNFARCWGIWLVWARLRQMEKLNEHSWKFLVGRSAWKLLALLNFQSIHEKCSHRPTVSQSTVLKPRSFLQKFRIRGSQVLIRHSKLSLLVRTSHALVLRHGRDWRLKKCDRKQPGAISKMEVWQPTSKPKLFVAGIGSPEQRDDGGWYVQEPRGVARVSWVIARGLVLGCFFHNFTTPLSVGLECV